MDASPYSPINMEKSFTPRVVPKVSSERENTSLMKSGPKGLPLEDQEREQEHLRYIQKIEKKDQRWKSYDNLISRGVDIAHSNIGNAMYGSPKRDLGKRLSTTPPAVPAGRTGLEDVQGQHSGSRPHEILLQKAPLPRINVPVEFQTSKAEDKIKSEPSVMEGAVIMAERKPVPPALRITSKQHHAASSPMMQRNMHKNAHQRAQGSNMKMSLKQDEKSHHLNLKIQTGKRQVQPRTSPRVLSNVLPLDLEPAISRVGKAYRKPVLTSRNEVNLHLWSDIRGKSSTKPTSGMFNPDLPSRKMLALPTTEDERLDYTKKARFLLAYAGGKAFTGYETDMPQAVVNRLKAYRNLANRRNRLNSLFANDVATQKSAFERRTMNW